MSVDDLRYTENVDIDPRPGAKFLKNLFCSIYIYSQTQY